MGTPRFAAALLAAWILMGGLAAASSGIPDPTLTPGAASTAVTNSNVHQTICVTGYTRTVRAVSSRTKAQVFAEYHVNAKDRRSFVIDHLIPLELGGSNSLKNLWPQLRNGPAGASAKDQIESEVHTRVCGDLIPLDVAQRAIATDWTKASSDAVTTTSTASTATPTTEMAPPSTPPISPPGPGNGATALCGDGTYSYPQHHQGACSHHGGVAQFYQ